MIVLCEHSTRTVATEFGSLSNLYSYITGVVKSSLYRETSA